MFRGKLYFYSCRGQSVTELIIQHGAIAGGDHRRHAPYMQQLAGVEPNQRDHGSNVHKTRFLDLVVVGRDRGSGGQLPDSDSPVLGA
jgi:hypothetical protein